MAIRSEFLKQRLLMPRSKPIDPGEHGTGDLTSQSTEKFKQDLQTSYAIFPGFYRNPTGDLTEYHQKCRSLVPMSVGAQTVSLRASSNS